MNGMGQLFQQAARQGIALRMEEFDGGQALVVLCPYVTWILLVVMTIAFEPW
jgi:hypothetical protein